MSVRAATGADARAIARIHVRAWQHNYAEILDPEVLDALDVEQRAQRWTEILAAGESVTLVWDQDGLVAGFASLRGERLLALYVEPMAQGAGVGAALLRAAEDAGARELTVFAANAQARAFYEAKGWEIDGLAGESMGQTVARYRCSSR